MAKRKRKTPDQKRKALKERKKKEEKRKEKEKREKEEMVDVVEVKRLEPVEGSNSTKEHAHEAMRLLLKGTGAKNIRPDKSYKRASPQSADVGVEGLEDLMCIFGLNPPHIKGVSFKRPPKPSSKNMLTIHFDVYRVVGDVDGHKCTASANIIEGDQDLSTVLMIVMTRDDGCQYNPNTDKWEKTAGQLSMIPVNYFATDLAAAYKKTGNGKLTCEQAADILDTATSLIFTAMKLRMAYPHKLSFDFAAGYSSFEKAVVGDLIIQNSDHYNDEYFGLQVYPDTMGFTIRAQDENTEEIEEAVTLDVEPGDLPNEVSKYIEKYWH